MMKATSTSLVSLLPVPPGVYALTVPGRLTGKDLRTGYRCIKPDGYGMDFLLGNPQPVPFDTLTPTARRQYDLRVKNPTLEILEIPFSTLPEALGYWHLRCVNDHVRDGELSYREMITHHGVKTVLVCPECDATMKVPSR